MEGIKSFEEYAKAEDCDPSPILTLSHSLATKMWRSDQSAPPWAPAVMYCPATGPRARGPSNHGLKSWVKINLNFTKLISCGFLSQKGKLTKRNKGKKALIHFMFLGMMSSKHQGNFTVVIILQFLSSIYYATLQQSYNFVRQVLKLRNNLLKKSSVLGLERQLGG